MSDVIRLSAFVLTKNEERNLEDCLKSLSSVCSDIHVLDSFSTDATLAIADRYRCRITQHQFEGHSGQREWALRNLPFENEWVIALDADHRLTAELANELRVMFLRPVRSVSGMFVRRRQIFRGRWIRRGGYYPKYMLKVFKHKEAFVDRNEFDYRFYVNGTTSKLRHDIVESNENEWSIAFFVEKHTKFSSELAAEEIRRGSGALPYLTKLTPTGNPDQRILWIKSQWIRLPLYVRPWLMFLYRYVIRLGFLDGKEGFLFHFMQTLWFRTLVDVRIEELRSEQAKQTLGV